MSEEPWQFPPGSYRDFEFSDCRFDAASGRAEFSYRLISADASQENFEFREVLGFAPPAELPDEETRFALERVLALLGAVLGISYYKASAAERIHLNWGEFTGAAHRYLEAVYSYGLGEFAYRAGLPALPQPLILGEQALPVLPREMSEQQLLRPLVAIGGGKDSSVTVGVLTEVGAEVTPFAVRPNTIIREAAAVKGQPLLEVSRQIDPLLFTLNEAGALNGHIPITAINSLIGIVQSLLSGLGPVVFSNEHSASEPTLFWNGTPINHQWSKSLEAEQLLSSALEEQAGLVGRYFSLLRPFSELRIARSYSRFPEFDRVIVSCNRAFRISGAEPSWCGDCDKCRFVFLALAPFLSKDRLVSLIGKNLYEDLSQLQGFRNLMGAGAQKPFECVGEEAESVIAVQLALQQNDWRDSAVLQALAAEAPELATGAEHPEAARIFANQPALPVPHPIYQQARDAIS